MNEEAQKAGIAPEKLDIILRINQSSNSAKKVFENLNALYDVGVQEIIVDVDWATIEGPQKTAEILFN